MTVLLRDGVAVLLDRCPVTDAETLLGLLLEHPGIAVDISGAVTLHTAVWQVLLALAPAVSGMPADDATNWLLQRILGAMISQPDSEPLAMPPR